MDAKPPVARPALRAAELVEQTRRHAQAVQVEVERSRVIVGESLELLRATHAPRQRKG